MPFVRKRLWKKAVLPPTVALLLITIDEKANQRIGEGRWRRSILFKRSNTLIVTVEKVH